MYQQEGSAINPLYQLGGPAEVSGCLDEHNVRGSAETVLYEPYVRSSSSEASASGDEHSSSSGTGSAGTSLYPNKQSQLEESGADLENYPVHTQVNVDRCTLFSAHAQVSSDCWTPIPEHHMHLQQCGCV